MNRSPALPLALAGAILLNGCGGDDAPAPPQPNRAPAFSSAATASVGENATGTVYTASASDADGDALTYSISGGADASAFRISAAGALTFAQSPNFERPADSDRDNVYALTLSVSDGSASATLALQVTVTNVGPDGFRVRRVAAGFNQPLFVAPVPGSTTRVFVVEKGGLVRILDSASGAIAAAPFLDVTREVSTDSERGLLGFATAPDYAQSGIFYVYLTNLAGDTEVRRYRAGANERADPASADIILTFAQPFSNHNGGWIGFGPRDGLLYIASGDGGSGGDPQNNAQNTGNLLGKILRIDVNRDDFPADATRDYGIPTGNPFTTGAREIWAFGLRNPFRASFDAVSELLFIGDVGQSAIEEIDVMRPTDGGANFGWRLLEGTRPFNGGAMAGLTAPIAEYPHGNGEREGRSVTGGYVYRGPVEALRGEYVFGDFVTGNIWSIALAEIVFGQTIANTGFVVRNQAFRPDAGTINLISSFGVDGADNLYIVGIDGEIFRVEATP